MIANVFSPFTDWGLLILRLAMGIIFFVHGLPKINPDSPMKGTVGFGGFLKQMGVPFPTFFAWVVALLETAGSALLILGLGTRLLALLFGVNMLAAIFIAKRGFLKVPFIAQQTTGWEFDFALLAISLALLLIGSGGIALDALLGL